MKLLCRMMRVSESGYYAWRKRLSKPPSLKRKKLADLVRNCYWGHRRRYGTRRIQKALHQAGVKVGRFQIRRLMREQNLKAIQPKSFKPRTTDSRGVKAAPNLLAQVKVEECVLGKLIIGDITYIPLRGGRFAYLAIWQDKVTRRIIGWSLSNSMTAELVVSALQKTIRKGKVRAGAIIHSDRGSQYAANAFRLLLQTNGFRQSMSGKGNCYDNAQTESFFSRFKAELIEDGVFEDVEQAKFLVILKATITGFDYIQVWVTKVQWSLSWN